MTCSQCLSIEHHFDKAGLRDLERYRRKGADITTRLLLEGVRSQEAAGESLLDVGGGVGVVHHELLDSMMKTAVNVEASGAYLEAAREESARRGHSARVRFVKGDLVALSGELSTADVVTLDRVICCYPDVDRLVCESVAKCRRLYALSYPLDRWYVRVVVAAENALRRLRGSRFRTYVHATDRVERLIMAAGLERCYFRTTLAWQVVVFRRVTGVPVSSS
jgi:magnesium-protoporphyrin O-methyltransferase